MGNDQQGAVLSGEVQAVKQGAGIFIDTDGTISVDASSVVGLVKLNNGIAFNGYIWPNTKGVQGQMLTMGVGNNLEWTNGGVFVSGTAPTNPEIGDLWFDCTTGQLLVYEACTSGNPKWTSGSEGLPIIPGNTSASPAFVSGSGTLNDPYICAVSSASVSGTIVVNRITVTDLAPFQFVSIIDLDAVVNGGRFSASNNVANASGILVFDLLFNDSPTSTVGTTYTCALKVGYGSVYIDAPVTLTDVFVLNNPGTISGTPQVSLPLTYTPGTAAGGAPPYTPSWVWKLFSDNSTLQTGGTTYTPGAAEFGDSVYVTLTIQDNEGQVVSGSTPDYGPISKPPFPNPTPPTIPTTIGGSSSFIWDGTATTLFSDGCLLFRVGAGSFDQGPTPVIPGDTVTTTWATGVPNVCGSANSGTFIEGCLFNTNFSTCASLTIDRIPDAFSILPVGDIVPGAVATSLPITLTGNNAPAFLTLGSPSLGTNFQASVNGGSYVAIPTAPNYTLSVNPGSSVVVRFTTGTSPTTDYDLILVAGDSTGNTSATFTATTGGSTFPTTPVTFPTTVNGTGSVGTSVAWGNGTTNITGTGCIEFSLDGTIYTQNSTQINDGNILRTRYKTGASCADNSTGQQISGGITNGTFTDSTNITINRVPGSFTTFGNLSNQSPNTQYTSSPVTPSGYNATAYVTLAAGASLTSVKASIGGGAFTTIPASGSTTLPIEPGQNIIIQGTTGASFTTTYSATVEIGVSGNVATQTWTVAVGAAVPTVDTPSITSPANNSFGVGTSSGVTYTSSPFVSRNGAGTSHASSDWQVYQGIVSEIQTSPITEVEFSPSYISGVPSRSLRFAGAQTFTRTPSTTATSRTTWTWSSWVKRAQLSSNQTIFCQGSTSTNVLTFQLSNATNQFVFTDVVGGVSVATLVTTASFLDCGEWFHVVLSVDTTSFITARRIRLFINNVEITNFSTAIYYTQGTQTSVNGATEMCIGAGGLPGARTNYLSSYLYAVNFIDGSVEPPSDFGASVDGNWIPKPYTGTYGNLGFELNFESQANPSATTIGLDTSGNSNNFTPNNIDTPLSNAIIFNSGTNPSTIDTLVVGGGGPGFFSANVGRAGLGAGAGGTVVETLAQSIITNKYYPLKVGAARPAFSYSQFDIATAGNTTSYGDGTFFSTIQGYGGNVKNQAGQNTTYDYLVPRPGGGFNTVNVNVAPTLVSGGFTGGTASTDGNGAIVASGGGGGAGGNASSNNSGAGFTSSISGSSVVYGGGGGGGGVAKNGSSYDACPALGTLAGSGGGAQGVLVCVGNQPGGCPTISPVAATPNRGGGGGGGSNNTSASGVFILRHADTVPEIPSTSIGSRIPYTVTTTGGFRIYTFTSSPQGTYVTNGVSDTPVPSGAVTNGYGNEVSGNYNIWNPNRGTLTVTKGGLGLVPNNSLIAGTVPMLTGKYYWELSTNESGPCKFTAGVTNASAGVPVSSNCYLFNTQSAQKIAAGVATSFGSIIYNDEVLGIAFDADEGKLWFSKNGTWFSAGNPQFGTNPAITGLTSGPFYPVFGGEGVEVVANFGQMPYRMSAPVGFGPVVTNDLLTILTFANDTNLEFMAAGESASQVGGGAAGIISVVDPAGPTISLSAATGTWLVGSSLQNDDISLPPGPPTTEPPDPAKYTFISGVTGSVVDLTSFTVATPPLDPFDTYYARVRYKSNAPVTTSNYSNWNTITTGSLV
jgi:hypothetical protein